MLFRSFPDVAADGAEKRLNGKRREKEKDRKKWTRSPGSPRDSSLDNLLLILIEWIVSLTWAPEKCDLTLLSIPTVLSVPRARESPPCPALGHSLAPQALHPSDRTLPLHLHHGQDVRLPVQAAADRRLRRGQDLRAIPILGGRIQRHFHIHHR